jgi:signal transduction histidine kinase
MKLTTKFAFVITAIIIAPVIITLFTGYVYSLFIMQDKELNRNVEVMRWMMHTLHKTREEDYLKIITKNMPEGIDLIALDTENRVLFSSVESIQQGIIMPPDILISKLTSEFPDRSQLYDPLFMKAYTGIKVFISLEHGAVRFASSPFKLFRWIAPLFFLLLIVSSVIGVIIISSFRTSIMALEKATKKITAGDLDFKLIPKGKDEIASLTRSFDDMREALREELAKRSRFLMAVSHDLSTPLTSIKGYIEAITDGLAGDRTGLEKYLSIISEKAELLETRIDELIEFVRLETGEWRLKQEPVAFKEFILQAVTMYREDALIFKRRFSSRIDIPETVIVTIDQSLLLRALENLFYNALRYTDENDGIHLEALRRDDTISLTIRDTGTGIGKDELARIFDPFFRGEHPAGLRGFGLGLSTVKSIINAHGWDISVESQPGEGTAFQINIKVT